MPRVPASGNMVLMRYGGGAFARKTFGGANIAPSGSRYVIGVAVPDVYVDDVDVGWLQGTLGGDIAPAQKG